MKKLLFLLLIPFLLNSQTIKLTTYPQGNDKEFYFAGASLDSGTSTTESIELNQFDNDLSLGYYLVLDTLAANDEIIGVYVQGKMTNGTWANVDTVIVSDTLNSSHTGLITKGLLNLNSTVYIFPYYRVSVVAGQSRGNIFNFKLSLYAYKRD